MSDTFRLDGWSLVSLFMHVIGQFLPITDNTRTVNKIGSKNEHFGTKHSSFRTRRNKESLTETETIRLEHLDTWQSITTRRTCWTKLTITRWSAKNSQTHGRRTRHFCEKFRASEDRGWLTRATPVSWSTQEPIRSLPTDWDPTLSFQVQAQVQGGTWNLSISILHHSDGSVQNLRLWYISDNNYIIILPWLSMYMQQAPAPIIYPGDFSTYFILQ